LIIKIYISEVLRYEQKALEVYLEKGMDGVQMFCVCSNINLIAVYSMLLNTIKDDIMVEKVNSLIEFYNVEVVK
jgi:hypothetical protein